jgi:hypothetical protein
MLSNKEALALADQIEAALPDAEAFGASAGDDLCKTYRSIAPSIKALLPVIALIPGVGPAVAKALKLLMALADQLCPTS